MAPTSSTMETSEQSLAARLQTLMEGSPHRWTYAIFWLLLPDAAPGPALLGWGDGYYEGSESEQGLIKNGGKVVSPVEQEHRKRVLRELDTLIKAVSGRDDGGSMDDQDVSDDEWFFLVSMAQSFSIGSGLPGLALASGLPQWAAGEDGLARSTCERALQALTLGMQTMVCDPVANGVLELGSTDLIMQRQDGDVVNRIRSLFGSPRGACRMRTQPEKNDEDLLALQLRPPPDLLEALMEGSRHRWTYVIFWLLLSDAVPGPTLLGWGDGYYKGSEFEQYLIKNGGTSASPVDQQHRKRVLRELDTLLSAGSGGDDSGSTDDHDVSDSEWFFLVSMTQSLTNGAGLLGLALTSGLPQWIAGSYGLARSTCERACQAQMHGMQTMVFVPVANGVVELGSTDVILQRQEGMDGEVVNRITSLFGSPRGACRMRMQPEKNGEDLLALRLGPPTSSV